MIKTILLSITCILFLSACSHSVSYVDGEIITYPTKDIDFKSKQYATYNYYKKTYQWAKTTTKVNAPDNKWLIPELDFENFTKNTIKQYLGKQGLKYSKDSADITVSFGLNINMAAHKYLLFGDADGNVAIPSPKGALTIVITNKKTNTLIWTAWASSDYKQLDKVIAKKRMEYAISEMFNKFPN